MSGARRAAPGKAMNAVVRALLSALILFLILGGLALAAAGYATGRWYDIPLGIACVAFAGLVCAAERRNRKATK